MKKFIFLLCLFCSLSLTASSFDQFIYERLTWTDREVANKISYIFPYGIAPVGAAGVVFAASLPNWAHFGSHMITLALTLISNVAATHTLKHLIVRERPESLHLGIKLEDAHVSFPSGHSSASMAMTMAPYFLVSRDGKAWAPAILWVGIPLSLLTGYLRLAAAKHWTTDVLSGLSIGCLVGSLFGVFMECARSGGPLSAF